MGFALFQAIVEKFVKDGVRIDGMSAGHWGEPLLNGDLPRMIRYVRSHPAAMKRGSHVRVNTTLNALPHPEELMQSGVDSVVVSMSGMRQDVYSRNHRGGNAGRVLEHIGKLAEIRKREKLADVQLRMAFHDYVYNREDADAARAFCEKHGVRFTLIRPMVIGVEGAAAFAKENERLGQRYRAFMDLDRELAGMRTFDNGRIKDCRLRKKRVTVNFDGQVMRCVNVFERKHFMGSVFDFDIKEIPHVDSAICRTCADTPISWR
ncbi:MAG: hypothetical protein IH624_14410 [Phycisphaerae bacterium]|nr:hypothetical protein [Phycisphaerae bacterium]